MRGVSLCSPSLPPLPPMRPMFCLFLVIAVQAPTVTSAQTIEASWGPVGAGYALTRIRSETPRAAIGVMGTVSRSLGSVVALRASGSGWASLPAGDPVSICERLPTGGCAPTPIVPERLWLAELHVLARPAPRIPVWLLGGVGGLLPAGDRADSLPNARAVWRWGVEIGDSKHWRGLRVQLTRIAFSNRIQSLRGAQSVAILF